MPLKAIVEYVFSANSISVYVSRTQMVAKVTFNFLFMPFGEEFKDLQARGKAFTEKLLLNRTVGVKFERVDDNGSIFGRIYHPAGDIACEVLKNGYSKL